LRSQVPIYSREKQTKPTIITNWKYQKPTKAGSRGLKKLLKYTSYRENPEHSALPLDERWTDCGLGGNWREVRQNCQQWAGPYVLAHHLVIAPAPDLIALVSEEMRYELVRETTERVIEQWHLERGLNVPEYSYCLHDRDTRDEGLQNLHTHIFVAGTIENDLGERESHRIKREQVVADARSLERTDNLHHIARQEFETLLDRTIGKAWRLEREQILEQDQKHQDTRHELSSSPRQPNFEIDF
jgi:hypothetical protein